MVACIILAVISHRLPQMVASMVLGDGHNGANWRFGMMTSFGTGVAITSIAGSAAAAASTAGTSTAAAESRKLEMDRIATGEAAIAAGSSNGSNVSITRPETNATGREGKGLTGSAGISRELSRMQIEGLLRHQTHLATQSHNLRRRQRTR